MLYRICRHVYNTDIITVDQGRCEKWGMKLTNEVANPRCLSYNIRNPMVFSLSTKTRQRVLTFGGPRQEVVTKKNTLSRSRLTRSRTTCPVSIKGDVTIEVTRPLLIDRAEAVTLYRGYRITVQSQRRRVVSGSLTKAKVFSNQRPRALLEDPNLIRWPCIPEFCLEAEYRGVANAVAERLAGYEIYWRTKHIEIKIHFVRDLVAAGEVRVLHVPSRYLFADIFTKGLSSTLFKEFQSSLSVRCPLAPTAEEC
ncbi:ribonuclease H-like domain-containing protein [Tanacetum coccineum]